jgi:hypothetical protein
VQPSSLFALRVLVPLVAVAAVSLAPAPRAADAGSTVVVRAYYDRVEDVKRLQRFDVWEFRDRERGYFLVAVDPERIAELEELGFEVELDAPRTAELHPDRSTVSPGAIPGFPCYRTVEETFATAAGLAAARPDLATWTDFGDTWQKTVGEGGHDMWVLRLTNAAVAGPKPKLVVTAAIHAREYTTAELATRFAERLVAGHGVDPDATWILDHHEVHLVLQTNPDGRKRAETGQSWRKNTNRNYCFPASNNRGADLNRNFEFEWGCCEGSSVDSCDPTYRGPFPASEPEVQAVQAYLLAQLPDHRGPALDDPAPADASGLYLDLHSFSELVLWPWGFSGAAPNATALTTLGRKLAFFNGYAPQQAIELYPSDGTTIDFVYGETGVAAFAFEIGTAFFESCSSFESTVLPENMDALVYAAKVARAPYLTPSAPDTTGLALTPAFVQAGESVSLTATLDGLRYNHTNGAEFPPSAASGRYYVDVPPWSGGAVARPLVAADGSFGGKVEGVTAEIDTTGLAGGRHTVFVQSVNQHGVPGPISAAFLWIEDGSEGVVSGTITDARTGLPLPGAIAIGALGVAVTAGADGSYAAPLPDGRWSIAATASGYRSAEAAAIDVTAGASVVVDFALEPSVLLVDGDDDSPDVRSSYTAALDAIGVAYEVFDTAGGTVEPGAGVLARHRAVVWFSGDATASAGPSPVAESALAAWLDSGRCVLVTSQDYHDARGLTPFLDERLGVSTVTADVSHASVTGTGPVYGSAGSSSLAPAYPNRTDAVGADASAATAFSGSAGSAGVSRSEGFDRTSYLAFGVDAVSSAAVRRDILGAFLAWCFDLPLADGDEDGTANGLDCAVADPASWSAPGPARDLVLDRAGTAWSQPAAPGATTVLYDVLRSGSAADFSGLTCVADGVSGTSAGDAGAPAAGAPFFYLVRVRNACGETSGAASSGAPRNAPPCP